MYVFVIYNFFGIRLESVEILQSTEHCSDLCQIILLL